MRLEYTPPNAEDYPPDVQPLVKEITAQRATKGVPLGPLYQTLLISPTFAEPWYRFMQTVRYNSAVPTVYRELSMCRVGAINGAAYEWAHHCPLMIKAGVSEEGAETVRTAARGEAGEGRGLTKEQWTVLRYCDAVSDLKVDDKIFSEMKDLFEGDDKKCLELTMTITSYNAVARFLRAVDVAEMQHVEVGKGTIQHL
ncbi:hypothetical protein NA57DRAFT_80858 [Rhizodiscina lignyota]|uniref:Carboxymuconolactone decarboxylase-like domain-containing protein n=1 Tax=Rhizodiscina lignyota TaxID=1504668 RepID=A0A9P4I5I1_9PEZI|nr:hypothetical protein NA57DRAFT_80858 [Rhizodiscina lignyota]